MPNHQKPTKEELEAQVKAAVDAEEKARKDPPVETPEKEPVTEELTEKEVEKPLEDTEKEVIEEKTEEKVLDKTQKDSEVNYKKRYTDSVREAQVVSFKNKEINQAVDEAATLTEPTEDEMKQKYGSGWDEMSVTEQMLAKDSLLNKKRFELIHGATQKFKAVEDWTEKVDTYIGNPKTLIANPELEGKQEEFKLFATKPTRRGLEFDDLVLAFLGDEAKKVRPNHKGEKMFETGTGGSKEPIKPPDNKLSLAQSEIDRKTNYTLYRERLKAGVYKTE